MEYRQGFRDRQALARRRESSRSGPGEKGGSMFKKLLLSAAALMLAAGAASAKDLKAVGITVGSLGNPFSVSLVKGATEEAHKINPNAQVTATSADYDLN